MRRSLAEAVNPIDPTRMRTGKTKYIKQFSKLFFRFNIKFADLFKRYSKTELTSDMVESFNERTLVLIDGEISVPGNEIIDDYVSISYRAGKTRTGQLLKPFGIEAAVGPTPADEDVLEILKQRNYTALKGITDDMSKTINRELTDGVLKGESMSEMSKRLRAQVGFSKNRAETFVSTEIMYAYSTAADIQYDRYGVVEIDWFTAQDERVCPRCGPLHGKRFKRKDAPPCPLHPRCRCTKLPVIGVS